METLTHQSVDERIAKDLAPFDEVAAKINSLRKEYHGLKINGPEDKDGYKMVHAAWQVLRDTRLAAEKLHKALTDDAKRFKQAGDARLRQIKEALGPMEDDFYNQWKAEDTRKEREKEQARIAEEQAKAKRIEDRKQALYAIGMNWNGREFTHPLNGVTTVNEAQVTGLDDAPFADVLARVTGEAATAKVEAERAAALLAEQERQRKAEAERQAAIAEENERKARELMEKEEQINAQLRRTRIDALKARGMVEDRTDSGAWLSVGEMSVLVSRLHEMGTGEFDNLCRDAEDEKQRWDEERSAIKAKAEKERIEREEREARERAEREERIAKEAAEKERARIEEEARLKKEAEEERIRQAGDIGAMQAMLQHLHDFPWPVKLKSKIAQHAEKLVREKIEACIAQVQGTIEKDLK